MHVAITGASSGIGEAIAREYAKAGASLTLVARRKEKLEKLAQELGRPSHVVAHDLSDPARVSEWLDPAEAALGPIDVLVNNAGTTTVCLLADMDPAKGEQLLRLNVLGPLKLSRAILPRLLGRKSGTIVDMSSVAAFAPARGMNWYGASKAALASSSEGLRVELKGTGVHVVTVYPGPIGGTEMAEEVTPAYEPSFFMRTSPWGTPDELARRVRRAVERRKKRVIYPRTYALARWCPPFSRWVTNALSPKPVAKKPT